LECGCLPPLFFAAQPCRNPALFSVRLLTRPSTT
jgi:hypothetical protein